MIAEAVLVHDEREQRRWRRAALLGCLPLALAVPSIVAGPYLHADDFHYLELARDAGWWRAGGPRQVGRPGAYLVYDAFYGLIGGRPVVLRVVLAALVGVVASMLYLTLRRWIGERPAVTTTVLWAVIPTHVALERWAACAHASVALILVLAALFVGTSGIASRRRALAVGVLLTGGVLTYEIVVPAVALVAAVLLVTNRLPWRLVPHVASPLVVAGCWVVAWNSIYPEPGRPGLRLDAIAISHLGFGLPASEGLAGLVAVTMLVALAIAAWIAFIGNRERAGVRAMMLAGAAVVVAGLVPAVPRNPGMTGLEDRYTTVSGIGVALLVAAGLEIVRRTSGRPLVAAVGLALVTVAAVGRVHVEQQWHRSGERTLAALRALDAALPATGVHLTDGPVGVDGRIAGIVDGWNATAAVRWYRSTDAITVCIPAGDRLTGPGCDPPRS